MITDAAKAMILRVITEHDDAVFAELLAKIKELEAECAAYTREIAIGYARAEKAEAEVAALRKRLVVDDAMVERAARVIFESDEVAQGNGDIFYVGEWEEVTRAVLEAALGSDANE